MKHLFGTVDVLPKKWKQNLYLEQYHFTFFHIPFTNPFTEQVSHSYPLGFKGTSKHVINNQTQKTQAFLLLSETKHIHFGKYFNGAERFTFQCNTTFINHAISLNEQVFGKPKNNNNNNKGGDKKDFAMMSACKITIKKKNLLKYCKTHPNGLGIKQQKEMHIFT